jgi:hypothetical protein
MIRDVNQEFLAFVCVGSLTVRAIGSETLALIGHAYCWLGIASQIVKCTEMFIALHSPRGHTLKADRSLYDPIVELKVDYPKIQVYLHVNLIWLAGQYKPYASGSIYSLGADQELCHT